MQPLKLRPTKRRKRARGGGGGFAGSAAANTDGVGAKDENENTNQGGAFGADEASDGEGVIQRSVVTELNAEEKPAEPEEKELPELPSIARPEGGSQIARLMAQRRDDSEQLDDEAKFRAHVARCADEVDADTYENVPIDKFAQRMLRAMGWRPPNRNSNETEKQGDESVPRPRGLGLGMKRDGGSTQPPPPTHYGAKKKVRKSESDEDNSDSNENDADVNGNDPSGGGGGGAGVFSNFTTVKLNVEDTPHNT